MSNNSRMHYMSLRLSLCMCFIVILMMGWFSSHVSAEEQGATAIKTESGGLVSRVAPGEFLPIAVKLVNFGGGRRVDVTITYRIVDSNNREVFTQSETVAVETTASFVKIIQIPYHLSPGRYTAFSDILYKGQEVPATAQFQFTVERKIAGIFVSQLMIYGIITVLIGMAFAVVSRLIIKKRRASRLTPHEYPNVPKHERLFYELISDTIMQMRYRVGDKALALARNVDGLTIDEESGRVLKISKNPATIIALLVLRYENQLGEKISFALRKTDKETKERLAPADKTLVIIRK